MEPSSDQDPYEALLQRGAEVLDTSCPPTAGEAIEAGANGRKRAARTDASGRDLLQAGEVDGCPGLCPVWDEPCRPECPGSVACRASHEQHRVHQAEVLKAHIESRCPPKHFAGVVTGVVVKDGMRQVLCALAIPGTDKHMALALPLSEEEMLAWAGELEGKVVLTLSRVEVEG